MGAFSQYIDSKKIMYFMRDTDNPQQDLARGWSCHVNSWMQEQEDAKQWQSKNGALREPLQDPITKLWCADPELGLSAWAFHDQLTFDKALKSVDLYSGSVAIFQSNDFTLNAGAISEDMFRNGTFLFYINHDCSWLSFSSKLATFH